MCRKLTVCKQLYSVFAAVMIAAVSAAPAFAAGIGSMTGMTTSAVSAAAGDLTVSVSSASYTYVPTRAIRYYRQAGKWRMDYTAKYTYKNGRLVKTVYGSDNLVEKYTYYKNGRLKKVKYYSDGKDLVETKTYKNYNSRGDAKTVRVKTAEDTYTIKYTYRYNKKGRIKKQTANYLYGGGYSEKIVTSYTYDAKGYPKTVTEKSVTSNTVTYKNKYYKEKYLKSATAKGWQKTVYSGFKKTKTK